MELVNQARITRGWTCLPFFPSMLLCKLPRGGKVAKNTKFGQGQWFNFLTFSVDASTVAVDMRDRRSWTRKDTLETRVEALICMGEILTARHSLEGSPVARGTEEAYSALIDENCRPPEPRDPRKARGGSAGGPSGMRTEHARPLLDKQQIL